MKGQGRDPMHMSAAVVLLHALTNYYGTGLYEALE